MMAGYKQTVKNLEPRCFLTFDGSSMYNAGTGVLLTPHITDESGYDNVGVLQTNLGNRKSYSMGTTGLVEREVNAGQASITFAFRGYDTLSTFPYEKSLVEVLHSETLDVSEDFTFMFLMNKTTNDNDFINKKWDFTNNVYTNTLPAAWTLRTIKRQIFRKGSTVDMSMIYQVGQDVIRFKFPNHIYDYSIPDNFHNVTHHITLTHRNIQISSNIYKIERVVYIDGVQVYKNLSDETSIKATASNTSPIEIAGNRDNTTPDYLDDRQTSPLIIDQFAVFNKCLTDNDVMDCYKKIYSYFNFIKKSEPSLYIPFDDSQLSGTLDVNIEIPNNPTTDSYIRAYYSDFEPYVTRGITLTDRIMGEKGAYFEYGMVKMVSPTSSQSSPVINATGDFTLEFWLAFQSTSRGVVFSCVSNQYPFKGLSVQVNVLGTQNRQGMIQVSLEEGVYLNPPEYDITGANVNYADNVIRHYVITRRGTELELWIDGVLVSSRGVLSNQLIPNYGQMYIMGHSPNLLSVVGTLGHLAFYNRALYSSEIKARAFYHVKMLIKGRTSIQGQPTSNITIRVFDHETGKLLTEGVSGEDGYYSVNVYSNNYIDLMFFDKYNQSVTYRVVGSILAQEYIDVEYW